MLLIKYFQVFHYLIFTLDGLIKVQNDGENSPVLFLASTNLPWTLDPAFLRRFQKIVNIPLPDPDERLEILHKGLKGHDISNLDLTLVSENITSGFSGKIFFLKFFQKYFSVFSKNFLSIFLLLLIYLRNQLSPPPLQ